MKSFIIFLAVLIINYQAVGQESPTVFEEEPATLTPLTLKAKRTSKGIALKFIPPNAASWVEAIENGFIIKRTLVKKGENTDLKILTPHPLKPYSSDQFSDSKQAAAQDQLLWQPLKRYYQLIKEGKGFQAGLALDQVYSYYMLWSTRNPTASIGSGMYFIDITASTDANYYYEISVEGVKPNAQNQASLYVSNEQTPLKAPMLYGQGGDHLATLKWEHHPVRMPFIAYFLEKSKDGKDFSLAYKDPIYSSVKKQNDSLDISSDRFMMWEDSLANNDQSYYYRLVGLDFFGEHSIPSETLEIKAIDLTPPSLPIMYRAEIDQQYGKDKILVSWQKAALENDLAGYMIFRSSEADQTFSPLLDKLLPKHTASFIDEQAVEGTAYNYTIMIVDQSGNYSYTPSMSAMLPDRSAPAAPTGIKWTISKAGVVRLHWDRSTEADIKGYRVYASNHEDTDFLSLTPMPLDTAFFQDILSMRRLNENYYYRIVAFDQFYNHSEFSETINVQIPDILPPSSPRHLKVGRKENHIYLNWQASSSIDVAGQVLYVKDQNSKVWEVHTRLKDGQQDSFSILTKGGSNYVGFCISSVDDAGLESDKSNEVFVKMGL